jgi:hypothetical protein
VPGRESRRLHDARDALGCPDELGRARRIVALFAAYLEDLDLALDALELFGRTAPPSLYQHLWYPLLADVRAEPRFKGVMREIGFADLWEKTGRWNDYCYSVGQGDFECR